MADVPKAEDVCLRHSVQWHMYSARGFSRGVLKVTEPHWQLASMFVDVRWIYVIYVSGILRPFPIGLSWFRAGKMSSSGWYDDDNCELLRLKD